MRPSRRSARARIALSSLRETKAPANFAQSKGSVRAKASSGNYLLDKTTVTKYERIAAEVRFYQRFSQRFHPEAELDQRSDEVDIAKFIARSTAEPVQSPKYVYVFMEYYSKGDLHHYSVLKQGLLENDAKYVVRNLLEAIQLLHEQGVVLRDIKPEN